MKIEKTVDRGSKEKLYVQIYSIILEKIESGEWPLGRQIPSEDELCRIYDVSKVTVREAIQELAREGYLKRQQGKGTFVLYSVPHPGLTMRTRLAEDDGFGEGVNVRKEVVERGVKEVPDEVKTLLMTEEAIYYMRRKKIVDDVSYDEEFFIPLFLLPDVGEEDMSAKALYEIIEEKGTRKIFKVQQTIETTRVTAGAAPIFAMREGAPALLISRLFISHDESPIAFSRLIAGGETYRFYMEFERIK
jgi:DNA-binding GntR family transcriptional regulator